LSQQKQARCIKKSAWKLLGLTDTPQQYRRVSPYTHILHDIGLLCSAKVCVSSKYYKVLLLKVKKELINTFNRSYIQIEATKTVRQQQNCEVARGLTAMANTLTKKSMRVAVIHLLLNQQMNKPDKNGI
jgi:hypothetical protein